MRLYFYNTGKKNQKLSLYHPKGNQIFKKYILVAQMLNYKGGQYISYKFSLIEKNKLGLKQVN